MNRRVSVILTTYESVTKKANNYRLISINGKTQRRIAILPHSREEEVAARLLTNARVDDFCEHKHIEDVTAPPDDAQEHCALDVARIGVQFAAGKVGSSKFNNIRQSAEFVDTHLPHAVPA
jgi:hypothetical protein